MKCKDCDWLNSLLKKNCDVFWCDIHRKVVSKNGSCPDWEGLILSGTEIVESRKNENKN